MVYYIRKYLRYLRGVILYLVRQAFFIWKGQLFGSFWFLGVIWKTSIISKGWILSRRISIC